MSAASYCYLMSNVVPSNFRLKLQSRRWKRKYNLPISVPPQIQHIGHNARPWGLEAFGCRGESTVPEPGGDCRDIKQRFQNCKHQEFHITDVKALWANICYPCLFLRITMKFNLPLVELQIDILWPKTVFLVRGCLKCSLIFQFLSVISSQAWKVILPGFKNLTKELQINSQNYCCPTQK